MFLSRFEVRFFTAKTIGGSFIKIEMRDGYIYQSAALDLLAFENAIYGRHDIKEIHLTFEESGLLFHTMILSNINTNITLQNSSKFIVTSVCHDAKTLFEMCVKREQLVKDYEYVANNLVKASSVPLNIISPVAG